MRASRFFRSLLKLVLACALVCGALTVGARARADIPVDGTWKQSPLKEEYTVQKWLSECGSAPVSGPSGGGEIISVHQEGDELAFVGGGRVFRTNQCYDQMPTLARETHTRDPSGKTWRTRCTTPPSDPRAAVINTLVSIGSDTHIDIVETGRYEISLNDGRCTADVKRTRSLDLAAREGPVASAPSPTPAPASTPARSSAAAENQCALPGDPARLEVRPSRKLLRTGDAFAFRAIVVDADGCATQTPTTWTFADPASVDKGVRVDANGKVTVAEGATEGTYDLVVSAAGKSARVSAVVASPSRYDDLLAASGLDDAGENQAAAVTAITGESIGGINVKAEDGSKRRRTIFLAIVAVVALALGVVAIIGARRTRRAAAIEREAQERHAERVREAEERRREKVARHAAATRAHEMSVAEAAKLAAAEPISGTKMMCPACRREYEPGSLFCPQDSNRLVALNSPQDLPMGPAGGMCPTCKRGFDPGVKVCPHDQDELVPYPLYASRNPAASPPRAKICPTCGGRFDGGAAFCGKDGTALVLLN